MEFQLNNQTWKKLHFHHIYIVLLPEAVTLKSKTYGNNAEIEEFGNSKLILYIATQILK
jgi:hypothetical protein